jgi:hypothetical protein
MLTFLKLWENMQSQEDSPLNASGESSLSMQAIRSGLELRGESNRTFWDDFLQLCNNGDGLSELLNVKPEQISLWSSRIRAMIEQVNREDDNQNASKKNVLPTGDSHFSSSGEQSPTQSPF